ncbi:MAG: dihydrofolate reductase family protein [Thermoplasmatota archaeon]
MSVSAFIGTSLDRFLARPNGSFDFLPSDGGGEAGGFDAFIAGIDAIVMGRNTFDVVTAMPEWPYRSKHLVVLSHRPVDLARAPPGLAERMEAAPQEVVARLAARGLRNLYVDGGLTIQSFLRAGLVDRLVVTTVPVLIGQGIPLFGPLDADIKLKHVATRTLPGGMVQSEYAVVR